jgi:hypothetical protein
MAFEEKQLWARKRLGQKRYKINMASLNWGHIYLMICVKFAGIAQKSIALI